ncbi:MULTISPECIES: hypothetical protein [unclassified Campylobacter]|uniref:hypothetical protein n=1 Tax=unclassified Campylobacter TaxID=2593542 RepID=UPI001D9E3E9A|nr:hypothetical protein [Campylobacter sp. RM12651]MBZ7978510.1 hypothetical protein [Campylobacter sp. RM12654]MBZ7980427.1 hypothetical protein [Campylobacter sp. RM12642]MBZ7990586.1 hypothetical protein [Campylobacter sp. RM9331]MBZ8004775.1 hypothetical protein [Campylobacter sp. RM9332]ULO04416.1 hypothetical protein AVBRAN_1987 [Campylobacter sp. RM12651]
MYSKQDQIIASLEEKLKDAKQKKKDLENKFFLELGKQAMMLLEKEKEFYSLFDELCKKYDLKIINDLSIKEKEHER